MVTSFKNMGTNHEDPQIFIPHIGEVFSAMDRDLKINFKKLSLSAGAKVTRNYLKDEKSAQKEEVDKKKEEIKGFRNALMMDLRKAGATQRTNLEKSIVTKKYGVKR